jgi:hypothetical protein
MVQRGCSWGDCKDAVSGTIRFADLQWLGLLLLQVLLYILDSELGVDGKKRLE